MSRYRRQNDNFLSLLILGGLLVWGCLQVEPLYLYGQIQWLSAALYLFTAAIGLRIVIQVLQALATFTDWISTHETTGKDGTAKWAKFRDLKKELIKNKQAPFWGRLTSGRKNPIFSDYASNAVSIAPAGSGKGIYTVVPTGLAIRCSKVFSDFKGELVCILKKALEERGERVRVLNPGGLWSDIIGESDSYNPLDIIVDDLERPGGLRDVPDDLREQCAQILPGLFRGSGGQVQFAATVG